MATRDDLLNSPRSGARPLQGSPAPAAARAGRPAPPVLTGRVVPARRNTSRPAAPAATKAPAAAPQPAKATPARTAARPSRGARAGAAVRSGRRAARAVSSPDFRNYQGIILAEFVAAELLVAATPIATRQHVEGLSPYIPRDMTKLLSLGLVYFVLELMAVGGGTMGRFGAWFGGLILIAVGLNEGANVAKTLDIFGLSTDTKGNG